MSEDQIRGKKTKGKISFQSLSSTSQWLRSFPALLSGAENSIFSPQGGWQRGTGVSTRHCVRRGKGFLWPATFTGKTKRKGMKNEGLHQATTPCLWEHTSLPSKPIGPSCPQRGRGSQPLPQLVSAGWRLAPPDWGQHTSFWCPHTSQRRAGRHVSWRDSNLLVNPSPYAQTPLAVCPLWRLCLTHSAGSVSQQVPLHRAPPPPTTEPRDIYNLLVRTHLSFPKKPQSGSAGADLSASLCSLWQKL